MDPSLPALERTDHSHTRAGRPRDRAARAAILQAANALLEENGIAGFGMEAVAARAGVGKSTIYRWWPSKGALAMAGFLAATEPKISYPKDGDSALDALRRQLLRVAEVYAGPTGRVMAAILAEGQRDPHTITAFVEGYARPRRDEARTILQAAITQGELRPDLDPEVVLDALYGPIYYRMLVPVGPLDIKWMDTLVQTVLDGIALPCL